MKKFIQLFKKVGGAEVLRQYMQGGVLVLALLETLLLGFSKKSLELVRLIVKNKLVRKLRKKYRQFISDFKANFQPLPRDNSKKMWVCWFQGIENAPPLVQHCYRTLVEQFPDREVILLTDENIRDYVTLPAFIEEKASQGIIPKAQFSDLIRLELLIRHGGTWIDATVLCSGGNIPAYMLDSQLFMFQNLKPGSNGQSTRISNWFITACTNHPLLILTRDLLYEYWKKHNKLVDYFIFHDLFELAIEAYPEEWDAVIPFPNSIPHILLLRLFTPYDHELWCALKDMTPFHKLSYKHTPEQFALTGTYYDTLFH